MKNIMIVILIIAGIFLFMTKEDPVENTYTDTTEPPKETELDTPTNTYKRNVEALSISNTIQHPVNNYLNSRVDAVGNSRKSVSDANKRMEEQNKAIEDLLN